MNWSSFNWLDYGLIFVVAMSVGSGIKAGFARISIGLGATVLGFLLGAWYYRLAAWYFLPIVNPQIANLFGFTVIFVATLIAGALVAMLLAKLFKWVGLSFFDRFLGGAFGVVRGLIMCAILLGVFVALSPKTPPDSVVHSRIAPYVIESSNILVAVTPRELKDAFQKSYDEVKKQWVDLIKNGKQVPKLERSTG